MKPAYANTGDLIFGLIMLVGVIASGLFKKYREAKEAEEDRRREVKRTQPGELPERTRRMLYGGDIPTARVRGARPQQQRTSMAPPSPPPEAPPKAPEGLRELMEVLSGRQLPPQRSLGGEEGPPPVPKAQVPRPKEQARKAPPPMRQRASEIPDRARRAHRADRAPAVPRGSRAGEEPALPVAVRQAQPRAHRREQHRAAPAPQHPHGRRRPRAWRLLNSQADVRRGIILSEVLGPPKSLR